VRLYLTRPVEREHATKAVGACIALRLDAEDDKASVHVLADASTRRRPMCWSNDGWTAIMGTHDGVLMIDQPNRERLGLDCDVEDDVTLVAILRNEGVYGGGWKVDCPSFNTELVALREGESIFYRNGEEVTCVESRHDGIQETEYTDPEWTIYSVLHNDLWQYPRTIWGRPWR